MSDELFALQSPAFADVPEEDVEAATVEVPSEHVEALVATLTAEYMSAVDVINAVRQRVPWLQEKANEGWSRDTALRYLRHMRDAANAAGHPVMSDNRGYKLAATPEELDETAERCERQAHGLTLRALGLRRQAQAWRLRQGA